MKYNFNEVIDRRNTGAIKLERCKTLFGTEDVLPLWVADMDFRTPGFYFRCYPGKIGTSYFGIYHATEKTFIH